MDISIILNKIKEHYNFRKDVELARHLGISPQALSNWRTRNSYDPQLLYTKCPEINPEWLLTGKEPMLKSDYFSINKLSYIKDPKTGSIPSEEKGQRIPLYDLENGIGLQEILKKDSKKAIALNFIKIPFLINNNGATYVKGNSMLPLLKNGDIIIFKDMSLQDLFWGEMYLVEIELDDKTNFLTIKYLHKSEAGEGFIKLVSENPNYEPKDIAINKIKATALICASIRVH